MLVPLCQHHLQALLNSSHMYYEAAKHFKSFGVTVGEVNYDWAQMQKQKDEAVGGLTKGVEGLFKKNKVCSTTLRLTCIAGFSVTELFQ